MRQALEMAFDWIKKQPEETPDSKYDVDTRYVVIREIEASLAQPEPKYRRGNRLICLETEEYCVIHISGTDRQWVKFPDSHIGVYTNEQVAELFDLLPKEPEQEGGVCGRCGGWVSDPVITQPEQEPVAWLSDDERKAFQRFYETWDDGEGYDVPKPMMKRLAQIGVIHHISRGLYDITKFGHSLLGYATSSHPPVPTAQPKELEQEISVAVLQAITNAGMTLLKTQHGYELRKLGPAIAHGIKE